MGRGALSALPVEVYQMWVQYPWPWGESACRLRAMMPELVTNVSVLTILAVSGERYVAITNPVYARTTHTLARTARVLPVIWLLSLVAAVPWGYYYQVRYSSTASISLPLLTLPCFSLLSPATVNTSLPNSLLPASVCSAQPNPIPTYSSFYCPASADTSLAYLVLPCSSQFRCPILLFSAQLLKL